MNIAARTAILGSILFSMGTACGGSDAPLPVAGGGNSNSSSNSNSSAGGSTGSSTTSSTNGGSATSSTSGGGSSTPTSTSSCPSFTKTSSGDIKIAADEASNYSFHSKLQLTTKSIAQKAAQDGVLEFDWGAVSKDMYGRTIDPKADIGGILVTIWKYPKADLETKINNDELITGDRAGAGFYFTKGSDSKATVAQLTSDGDAPLNESTRREYFSATQYPADKNTMLVMLQKNGTTPGKDGRMLTTFTLSEDDNADSRITLDNNSAKLEYGADFSRLKPLLLPAGSAKVMLDWSQMTKNALQLECDPFKIDKVIVASYDQPISELQKNEKFIDLETLATKKYESNQDDITNPKLSLTKLTDSDGNAFGGIDADHTWIVALFCAQCLNPAPWYISVLQTCKQ